MHLVRALVEGGPQRDSSVPAQTSVGDTAALILAANAKRKGFIIQNTGTTVLKITLSTTAPSQTAYHVALKGCSVADDGSGSVYFDDTWVGPVYGISSVPGGTCVITELEAGAPNWDVNADWGIQQALANQ